VPKNEANCLDSGVPRCSDDRYIDHDRSLSPDWMCVQEYSALRINVNDYAHISQDSRT
jgi:hypothetical protein